MSILVGRHIRKMLFDSRLADDVNGHIFLDGLNRECDFPFIVYNYTVEPGEGSKDYKTDLCQVSVFVFSKEHAVYTALALPLHQKQCLLVHRK